MNIGRKVLCVALLAGTLSSGLNAIDLPSLKKLRDKKWFAATEYGALVFLGSSLFTLFQRQSKKDVKPRYVLKDLINMRKFANNPKEWFSNLWLTYYDGFVGQCYKEGHLAVKEHHIIQGKKALPFGVLGKTISLLKVSDRMQKNMQALNMAAGTLIGYKALTGKGLLDFMFDTREEKISRTKMIPEEEAWTRVFKEVFKVSVRDIVKEELQKQQASQQQQQQSQQTN